MRVPKVGDLMAWRDRSLSVVRQVKNPEVTETIIYIVYFSGNQPWAYSKRNVHQWKHIPGSSLIRKLYETT